MVLNCLFRFYLNGENIECIMMGEVRSDVLNIFLNVLLSYFWEYFFNFVFLGLEYIFDLINGVEFIFFIVLVIF